MHLHPTRRLSLFSILLIALPLSAAGPQIELVSADREIPADMPVVPWVADDGDPWEEGVQLFELPNHREDGSPGPTFSRGWAAVSADKIWLRFLLEDDYHINTRTYSDIWDGDSIQLGIDARGDGVGALEPNVSVTGPDDASITFALTDQGIRVWAHYHGRPGGTGALPASLCDIRRDEEAKTTTYDLVLPWSEFQSVAGMSPVIGLALQINDQDESETNLVFWGYGAGGAVRPGLFNRLAIDAPAGSHAALCPTRSELWRPSSAGEIAVAVASKRRLQLRARLGGYEERISIPDGPGLRRFILRGLPESSPDPAITFAAVVVDGREVLAEAEAELTAPGGVMKALTARVEALAATSPHPLFTRHLHSIDAVVRAEWNRAAILFDSNPSIAREAIAHAERILKGLEGDAGRWQDYSEGHRSLSLTFVSSTDRTLQQYHLVLPRNWSPEKTYPLIVDLHGAGSPHPLDFLAGPGFAHPVPDDVLDPLDAYLLLPWGRGNRAYLQYAEDDVWEAMADVARSFKTDPDRHYLTGFSMGGLGTWHLALRTPDRWAAICIAAGSTWLGPTGIGLGGNLAHDPSGLPVRIWHGESDNAAPASHAYAMQEELRDHGMEPDMVIIPGHGHSYTFEAQRANYLWLLQHTRQRPESFSFVADTRRHTDRNGIAMEWEPAMSCRPRFTCRIMGRQVHLETEGTPRLWVDLGEKGLGMSGQVEVYLNGEEAYTGAAEEIELHVEPE